MNNATTTTTRKNNQWITVVIMICTLLLQKCNGSVTTTDCLSHASHTSPMSSSSLGSRNTVIWGLDVRGGGGWFGRKKVPPYQTMIREENERLVRQIQRMQQELTMKKQQLTKQTEKYQQSKHKLITNEKSTSKQEARQQQVLIDDLKQKVKQLEKMIQEFQKIQTNLQNLLEAEREKVADLQSRLQLAKEQQEQQTSTTSSGGISESEYKQALAELQKEMEQKAATQLAELR